MAFNYLLDPLYATFMYSSVFQVVKMMMGVVTIFLVCWLPYHTYFITANLYPSINYSHYIQVTRHCSSNCRRCSSSPSNNFFLLQILVHYSSQNVIKLSSDLAKNSVLECLLITWSSLNNSFIKMWQNTLKISSECSWPEAWNIYLIWQ